MLNDLMLLTIVPLVQLGKPLLLVGRTLNTCFHFACPFIELDSMDMTAPADQETGPVLASDKWKSLRCMLDGRRYWYAFASPVSLLLFYSHAERRKFCKKRRRRHKRVSLAREREAEEEKVK